MIAEEMWVCLNLLDVDASGRERTPSRHLGGKCVRYLCAERIVERNCVVVGSIAHDEWRVLQ